MHNLKLELGLVKVAELGSNKFVDYFLNLNVDVNCLCIFNVRHNYNRNYFKIFLQFKYN